MHALLFECDGLRTQPKRTGFHTERSNWSPRVAQNHNPCSDHLFRQGNVCYFSSFLAVDSGIRRLVPEAEHREVTFSLQREGGRL